MAFPWSYRPRHPPAEDFNPFYPNRAAAAPVEDAMDVLYPPMHRPFVLRIPRPVYNESRNPPPETESDPLKFELKVDLREFHPNELSVKIAGYHLVIHGVHKETADEHGFVAREIIRRYAIPEGVEYSQVLSSFSADGILCIEAPRRVLESSSRATRIVPITVEQPDRSEEQQSESNNGSEGRRPEGAAVVSDEQQRSEGAAVVSDEQQRSEGAAVVSDEQQRSEGAAVVSDEQQRSEEAAICSDEKQLSEGAVVESDKQQQSEAATDVSGEQQSEAATDAAKTEKQ